MSAAERPTLRRSSSTTSRIGFGRLGRIQLDARAALVLRQCFELPREAETDGGGRGTKKRADELEAELVLLARRGR